MTQGSRYRKSTRRTAEQNIRISCGGAWGHIPAPINEGSVYMHGGGVNGVKPFGAQEELITSVSNLRGPQAGGCSLIETNMEWKRYEYRRNTKAILQKKFGAVRSEFSTSAEKVKDTHFKPGGTVTAVLGKWANLVIESGSDAT
jgi:hypothetical protein